MKQKITLRTLSIMLGVLLCVGMQAANKIGDTVSGDFKFKLYDDNTAEVSANNATISGEIEIPENVTYNEAEYTVTSIGENGFARCAKITSVIVPSEVTQIGAGAFNKCANLASITLSENGITSIGAIAFAGCTQLSSITLPNSLIQIGSSAFSSCTSLTSISVPNTVTTIGESAFSDCSGLASITLGSGLKNIGRYTFNNCTSLTAINIPEGVTRIFDYTFNNCAALTSATIPNSVTFIEEYAFQRSGITSITLNNVDSIQAKCFNECKSLSTVTFGEKLDYIGVNVFDQCTGLTKYIVAEGNPKYSSFEDVLYNKDKTTLIAYPNLKSTNYTIPKGVLGIASYAFLYCQNLESITLPKGLTHIGMLSFSNCSNLKKFICSDSIPPLCDVTPFFNATDAILYVPVGSKTTYEEASNYWIEFAGIKEIFEDGKLAYYITAEAEEGGKILINEIEAKNDTLKEGTTVTFKFVPETNKVVDKVTVNEEEVTVENNTYIIESLEGDIVIKASFKNSGSSISELPQQAVRISSSSNKVVITNAPQGEVVSISNLTGQTVYQGIGTEITLAGGVYLVKVGNSIEKVIVK